MSRRTILILLLSTIIVACNNSHTKEEKNPAEDNEVLAVTGAVTGNAALTTTAISEINDTNNNAEAALNNMYANNDKAKNEMAARKTAYKMNKASGFYPEGSQRKLTVYDIQYLSAWGHNVILNEIYARHGMIFSDEALNRHFRRQAWYKPVSKNIFQQLTQIEKENITFLLNHMPENK